MGISKIAIVSSGIFAALTSTAVLAFDFDGVYVLGGLGYAGVAGNELSSNNIHHNFKGDNNEDDLLRSANPSDLETDGDFAWRIGAGTWLTDHFGLELNYYGVEENGTQTNGPFPTGLQDPDGTEKMYLTETFSLEDIAYFDFSGIGRLFLADDFWTFLRVGVSFNTVERTHNAVLNDHLDTFDNSGPNDDLATSFVETENGIGASLGFGFQYDVSEMIGLRVEGITIQTTNESDLYAAFGNIVVNFGE